jgi:hypothetical protein
MSSTLYLLLVEITILLHFMFVLFVAAGGLLLLRWPRIVWIHLPMLLWGIYIQFSGGICPLTPLEKYFRQMAGMQTYEGGFINQYIMPILYPRGLTHETQIMIGIGLVFVNMIYYSLFLYRQRHKQKD